MSDEGEGGRFGKWWSGHVGRMPKRIVYGVGAGAFGVAIYYSVKPQVLPLLPGGSNGGGNGGPGSGLGAESQLPETNVLEEPLKFLAEHSDGLAVFGIVTLLAILAQSRGESQGGGSLAHA